MLALASCAGNVRVRLAWHLRTAPLVPQMGQAEGPAACSSQSEQPTPEALAMALQSSGPYLGPCRHAPGPCREHGCPPQVPHCHPQQGPAAALGPCPWELPLPLHSGGHAPCQPRYMPCKPPVMATASLPRPCLASPSRLCGCMCADRRQQRAHFSADRRELAFAWLGACRASLLPASQVHLPLLGLLRH